MAPDMAPGLQFRISDFREELRVLSDIAKPFLAPGGEDVLAKFRTQIDGLWSASAGTAVKLQIEPSWPLETICSDGAYDHAGGARFNSLWCRVTAAWTVSALGPPVKSPTGHRTFEISGEASTVIELLVDPFEHESDGWSGEEHEVASWRMEIGNLDADGLAAPGPLFHVQVPGLDAADELQLWPHWLSVPRFHSMPFTPMAAIEFGLTEVFQHRWIDHVASPGLQKSSLERWARIQELRLVAYLRWQQDVIQKSTHPTPLLALKQAGPMVGAFVGLT